MQLFRGTFLMKSAELFISVFEIFLKMSTILGKYCKIIRREIKH